MSTNIEDAVINEGGLIFAEAKTNTSLFNKQFWLGRMLEWVMKDPSFKVDLFRFVDGLPMLKNTDQVCKLIKEYLQKKDRDVPLLMNTALKAVSLSLAQNIAAKAIKKNVEDLAQKFIAGVDVSGAGETLQKLSKEGFCFTLDLLGETTLSEAEADSYLKRYVELIGTLPSVLKSNATTDIAYMPNVSVKISALSCNLFAEDP